jgi:hypothetical protein
MSQSIDEKEWLPYFEAINFIRNQKNHQLSKITRWILIEMIIAIVIWIFFSLQIAMFIFMGLIFVTFNFSKKLGLDNSNLSKISEQQVKGSLLQKVASQVSCDIQYSHTVPNIHDVLKSNILIHGKRDFAHYNECLAGSFDKKRPFFATYLETGYYETYKNSNQQTVKTAKTNFQGMFVIIDFAHKIDSWVKIEPENLVRLGWLVEAWRSHTNLEYIHMDNSDFERHYKVEASNGIDANHILSSSLLDALSVFKLQFPELAFYISIKNQILTIVLPMKKSPFTFSNNQELWIDNLNEYIQIVEILNSFLKNIQGSVK